MPLHYVLLFPRGEYEWHWGRRLQSTAQAAAVMEIDQEKPEQDQQKRLPQRAFYRFRLHVRPNESKILFLSKRLFQQYVIDAWAVCEQTKLDWIKANQKNFRVDATSAADTDLEMVGKTFILPSGFTGDPRFMTQLYCIRRV